jgi:hypothetical protein
LPLYVISKEAARPVTSSESSSNSFLMRAANLAACG